jgi:ABC-type uncharacterized transport system involved in gliding motility auxiliary subunit
MKVNRKLRLQLFIQNSVFVILLFALAAGIGWVTRDLKLQWDLTQGKRNTLSTAAADVLRQLKGPINVTAYATSQDAEGDVRKTVQVFLAPFQRGKSDFNVTFVDPRAEPQKVQAAGVRVNGELVVEYNNRSEHLTSLTEQDLANLLLRLARSAERQVMFLDGHGEARLDGRSPQDMGEFGGQLSVKGFQTAPLNLATAPDVPENLSALIIAGPKVDLLPGEVARIRRWVEKGGNLFWLVGSGSLRGLQPLAEELGVALAPGTVVDPNAPRLKLPATFSLATSYGQHSITRNSTLTSVFPYARPVAAVEGSKWRFTPLVEVAQGGWLETGSIDDNVAFTRGRDIPGPLVIGAALERDVGDRKQRVVLVGSALFLSNQYAGLLGNLDLGINTVNWLAGDDALITIQPRSRQDLTLELSRVGLSLVGFGFLIVLPLAFLLTGGVIWWRRRKT